MRFKIRHNPKSAASMSPNAWEMPEHDSLEIEADKGKILEQVRRLIYDHMTMYRDRPLGILLPLSDYFGMLAHLWYISPSMQGRTEDIQVEGVPIYPSGALYLSIMLRHKEAVDQAYRETKSREKYAKLVKEQP